MWHEQINCRHRMRTAAVLAMAAVLGITGAGLVSANPPAPPAHSGENAADPMWVRTFPLDESRHALLIVDPILRHVAIYHVDTVAGTLTLKSSRDISGDLRLGDFNAKDTKPATLQKMLEMSVPAASSQPLP